MLRSCAVAIADHGSDGEVRYFGEVDASEENMRWLVSDWPPNMSGCTSATKQARPGMGCTV